MVYFYLFYFKEKYPMSCAKRVNLDQTPRFAASDLGLHCLPMSFYGTLVMKSLNASFILCDV